jgi:hypothetical protein
MRAEMTSVNIRRYANRSLNMSARYHETKEVLLTEVSLTQIFPDEGKTTPASVYSGNESIIFL